MFDRMHRHGRLIGIGLAAALLNACGGGGASSPETEPFYIQEEEDRWTVKADFAGYGDEIVQSFGTYPTEYKAFNKAYRLAKVHPLSGFMIQYKDGSNKLIKTWN